MKITPATPRLLNRTVEQVEVSPKCFDTVILQTNIIVSI